MPHKSVVRKDSQRVVPVQNVPGVQSVMFDFSSGDLCLNDPRGVCGQSVAVERQRDPERKDPDRSIEELDGVSRLSCNYKGRPTLLSGC